MVQFPSIIFFLGFLQFLLGVFKFPVFLCHPVFRLFFVIATPTIFHAYTRSLS